MFGRRLRVATITAALAMMPASGMAQEPAAFTGFLTRLQGATGHLTEASSLNADLPAWVDDEIAWAFDHMPHPCYTAAWGRWLLVLEAMQPMGRAAELVDAAAVIAVTAREESLVASLVDSLDDAQAACAAAL